MNYDEKTAKYYDKVLYPALNGIRKKMVKIAKKYNAQKIVDLCCGTGNQLKYLMKAGFTDVVGVDLSENMIAQAKTGEYQPECILDDATKTPFDDNSFDFGMVSFALHEKPLQVAEDIIKEAKRIIKPGGHFAVVDYCFDKKTYFPGRWGATYVEYLAGGEHYENFKNYIAKGGLNYLFKNQSVIEEKRFLFGAVGLRVYKF